MTHGGRPGVRTTIPRKYDDCFFVIAFLMSSKSLRTRSGFHEYSRWYGGTRSGPFFRAPPSVDFSNPIGISASVIVDLRARNSKERRWLSNIVQFSHCSYPKTLPDPCGKRNACNLGRTLKSFF